MTQTQGNITVTVAVPDQAESQVLTGIDLYKQGIQPVWLKVNNRGAERVRVSLWSIDSDYFSPLEVAYMNRDKFSGDEEKLVERWFYENSMSRRVEASEHQSGLVYTHLMPGTKGFNVDVFSSQGSKTFTFFVPIPGFTADHMNVDFTQLYGKSDIQSQDRATLKTHLEEQLPCCATNKSSKLDGGPFNIIFVGSPLALRRSLLRGGWHETEVNSPVAASARKQHYLNRSPDGTFIHPRGDNNGRMEVRIWLSPYQLNGTPVWIGQSGYDVGAASDKERDMTYRIEPDIDNARDFILQNFWYNQSLTEAGFIRGVGKVSAGTMRKSFTDEEYFTDGLRVVLFVSENPIAFDETKLSFIKSTISEELRSEKK